jgi:selT/selW/selH-like putative selenoprotein
VTSESTPGVTGWLEVSVNGKLIHSKKGGNGYIDSDAKMKKILDAIKEAKAAA